MLGIDCGSAFTKVALIEPVDGRYRLIARGRARTTLDTHILDGVNKACSQIEALTGRQLFVHGELLSGDVSGNRGAEVVAVSLTCHSPLRVLATTQDAAVAAERMSCLVTRSRSVAAIDRLRQLQSAEWDAVLGSPADVAGIAKLLPAMDLPASDDPTVRDATEAIVPRLIAGSGAAIEPQLNALSIEKGTRSIPGLAELVAASTEPVLTGSAALLELTQLLARRFRLRLVLLDCGAQGARLAVAGAENGALELRQVSHEEHVIPTTMDGLRQLHRRMEETLGRLMPGVSGDLLLASGGVLSSAPRPAQVALMLLNGVRPRGVIQLASDTAGILSQLASIAASYPDVASQVFEADGLAPLGTAICLEGSAEAGQQALEIQWPKDDRAPSRQMVDAGTLVRFSLPLGARSEVKLFPAESLDVGLGQAGAAAGTSMDGGLVGVMVDARLGKLSGDSDTRFQSEQALEAY